MHSNALFAVGAALLSVVAAVPMAELPHHHRHNHRHKRDYIWVAETEVVIETVALTKTVWLQPSEYTPESKPYQPDGHAPAASDAQPTPAAYIPAPYNPPPPANPPPVKPPPPAYSPPEARPPPANPPPAYIPAADPPAAPAADPPAAPAADPPPANPPAADPPADNPPPPAYSPPAPPAYVPPPAPEPAPTYAAPPSEPAPAPALAPAPEPAPPSVKSSGSGISGVAAPGTSYTGDLTWYDVGLGACGNTNTKDEAVVAIPESIFDAYNNGNPNLNPLCGGTVTITGKDGQKHTAKIVDRCPGCKQADLDLSQDFFNKVTNNGDGRVGGMEWCFD